MTLGRRILLPGLILGAMLRISALPLGGTGDVVVWKVWSFAATSDLTGVYGVGGSPPERRVLHWQDEAMTVDYPPLTFYELAAAGHLYRWRHPLFEDSRTLTVLVKLPGLIAELLLVALVLSWGRRQFGEDAAAWTTLALWLNPALLLNGPVLGYLDAQMAVPAAMALTAASAGWGALAGALAAVALLTKAQAIFVMPVIAALLFWRSPSQRWRLPASAAIAGTVTSSLLVLPYIVRGAWANLVQAVGRLAAQDMISAQAVNVWWIFTWVVRVLDSVADWGWWRALTQEVRILAISVAVQAGYPNARVIGLLMVSCAIAWAVWRARRISSLAGAAALTAWCAYAYMLLAAQVHENHLYLTVPLLAIAAGLAPRYRRIFWSVSAIAALNLYLFYGSSPGHPPIIQRNWTIVDTTVVLSFVNVGVFVWFTRTLIALTPVPDTPSHLTTSSV